jgi:hypothetical protein
MTGLFLPNKYQGLITLNPFILLIKSSEASLFSEYSIKQENRAVKPDKLRYATSSCAT